MASAAVIPDNTVLINFAHINRMDVLKRLIRDRGIWCASVAQECSNSAKQAGLEALEGAVEIFGDPLYPDTEAEHLDVRLMRLELAQPGDSRYAHLGEAETIAIVTRRQIDAIFITDDRGAARLAKKYQVRHTSTWSLLRLASRAGFLDRDTVWSYVLMLANAERGAPSDVRTREQFEKWLDG